MANKSKAIPEVSEDLVQDPNISPLLEPLDDLRSVEDHRLTILQAARNRHEKELVALQAQIDELSDEFAARAAAIVRSGLQSSYVQARQKIGAIDLSFFDHGDELSQSNHLSLSPAIEAEVTA